ncbi:TELO2-interacting protein 1 [Phytophthora citrophthora]|uniref:TELO2-interacting protein 1 n=1 Tax=Phytophthora citrophthora TaxID=4793 RepID=A0AAD9LTG2_9STRA|nr:TELO2-interacting protein 1 [Phytophthora citrophthora]
MADVATYVELCTRLSRFMQLHPSAAYCEELKDVMSDLILLYDRVDLSEKRAVDDPRVGFAAMDDLVLLSLHKLLGAFILYSLSVPLQEKSFKVFTRVLRRSKTRMRGDNPGKTQRRLSFVQSCVLYLPPPPEAGDSGEDGPGSLTIASQPEELRLAVLESLREILQEEEPNQELLLQTDQQHFFAYVVASLLHVAQRDRCREAALQAVEVLKCVLVYIHDPSTLRQYLPGVAAGLWKSANAPQQTSKVIVAALECLATALNMCIGDDCLPRGEEGRHKERFTIEAIRQAAETKGSSDESSPRENDKWHETTAINLDLLFSRMFAAGVTVVAAGPSTGLPRSSWRVRRALAQLCGAVMLQCRRALRISFFRCYDELLVLHGDAITEVAQEASKILQKLQGSILSSEERLQVLPEMADRFQMLLSTLVLKVATEHEATKVHLVRTLRGYLSFLGSSLTTFLDAAMENIYTSLCRVVSFAALDIELVVHRTLPNLPNPDESDGVTTANVVISQFQKRLSFFNEEASVREVLLMLREVGAIATPAGFIDCAFMLLSETNSAASGNAEIFLVLNELLRAYCPSQESSTLLVLEPLDIHLVGRILDDLLALDAWEEHKSPSSRGSSRLLVSQRALMVECVGVCAEILGAEFKVFLLHVLYPLVEQLGSHSIEVERAALAALEKVYFFTGYESLEVLFEANMDYFVDSLCSRLEQLDEYPMTAFVVEALLRHTRLASLPLVDEVASSLLRSVDLHQDSPHIDGLLRALKALLGSIANDFKESRIDEDVSTIGTDEAKKSATSPSLLDNFIHEMKVLESGGIDTIDVENGTEEGTQEGKPSTPEEMPDVKGAMPLEYDEIQPDSQGGDPDKDEEASGYRTLVIDIMDRCGYFLVDSDPVASCLVLSLIDEGVQFLSYHQKQLLPLVARIWPELLPRLRVENRAIATATVHVITTLAETAGDFVGDRFVETVWPILRSQIQSISFGADSKSSHLSRSMLLLPKPKDGSNMQAFEPHTETEKLSENELSAVSGSRKTQEIRQLLAILSCLTMVCQRSETATQLVPEITHACSKYLSRAAPQEIVEQTSTLFAALVQLNGDEVFCTIAALASWEPCAPPSSRFSSFELGAVQRFYQGHLSHLGGPTQSCRENASILMNRLFC